MDALKALMCPLLMVALIVSIEAANDNRTPEQKSYDDMYLYVMEVVKSDECEVLRNAMEHLRRRRDSSSMSSSDSRLQAIAMAEAIYGIYYTRGVNDRSRRNIFEPLFDDLIKEPCERVIDLNRQLEERARKPGVVAYSGWVPEVRYLRKLLEVCGNQVTPGAIDRVYNEYRLFTHVVD